MKQSDLSILKKVAEASKQHTTLKLTELNTALTNNTMSLSIKSLKIDGQDIIELINAKAEEVTAQVVDTKVADAVSNQIRLTSEVSEDVQSGQYIFKVIE